MEETFKFVESYARSYMYYILAFFGELKNDADSPPPSLSDGKLLIFSMMNAVIVAALQGMFIAAISLEDIDFYQSVIIQVCYWLFLCIVLHFVLTIRGKDVLFADSITAILQVVPVAFVIGAYAAFVFYFLAIGIFGRWIAPWIGGAAAAIAQLLLMARYLPGSTMQIVGPSERRKKLAANVVTLFVAIISFVVLGATWSDKKPTPAAPAAQKAAQKAAQP